MRKRTVYEIANSSKYAVSQSHFLWKSRAILPRDQSVLQNYQRTQKFSLLKAFSWPNHDVTKLITENIFFLFYRNH